MPSKPSRYTSNGMGVRGSPRRLGLENEDLPKVTYNLIDPEQYRDRDIAVVGGGNAAAEAAQMLADPQYGNRTVLLVRSGMFDRCHEENQKKLFELEKAGHLKIWFESQVEKIEPQEIVVKRAAETVSMSNDYLFVFAGAETPYGLLKDLGVKIERSFGDRRLSPKKAG